MKQSHFYAMMARMKYINRWGLMNNTKYENISEHSQQVAVLAHCLILIHNKRFGGKLDPERAALLAVFHDATEIITGDMPTPIKYANPEIRDVYRQVERSAADRLLGMLISATNTAISCCSRATATASSRCSLRRRTGFPR